MLVGVYIPLQACMPEALQAVAEQITSVGHNQTDSVFMILGNFKRDSLIHELPKYRQHVICSTRDGNILDNCYTLLKGAY